MKKLDWDDVGGRRTQQDIIKIGSVYIKWVEWISFFLHLVTLLLALISLVGIFVIENKLTNEVIEIVTIIFILMIIVNHIVNRYSEKNSLRKIMNKEWINSKLNLNFNSLSEFKLDSLSFSQGESRIVDVKNEWYWLRKNYILDLKNFVMCTTIYFDDESNLTIYLCPELITINSRIGKVEFKSDAISLDGKQLDLVLNYEIYYKENSITLSSTSRGKEFNIE